MSKEELNYGVGGVDVGGLKSAGALKDLRGRKRRGKGGDVVFRDL